MSTGDFLKGNQLWKLRTKIGRDKIFSDGAVLWSEALKYFEWCDRHPLYKVELVKYQGLADEADVPLGRPYTMDGLTVFLGVSPGYFRAAKSNIKNKIEANKASEDEVTLLDEMERIELIVRDQQISGAAVNIFSPNLVARLNGLAENVNQATSGEAVIRVSVRDQATADDLAELEDLL